MCVCLYIMVTVRVGIWDSLLGFCVSFMSFLHNKIAINAGDKGINSHFLNHCRSFCSFQTTVLIVLLHFYGPAINSVY